MKQKLTVMFLLCLSTGALFAQKFLSPKKPALIGLHFTLVDYNSPKFIDSTSLKNAFRKGDIFNPNKQSPAFTISYWKGLSNNFDVSGKANGIFYDFVEKAGGATDRSELGLELE